MLNMYNKETGSLVLSEACIRQEGSPEEVAY